MKVDLQTLGQIERDVTMQSKLLKGLSRSYDAQGDLLVARNAAGRVFDNINGLLNVDLELAAPAAIPAPPEIEPEATRIEEAPLSGKRTKRAKAPLPDGASSAAPTPGTLIETMIGILRANHGAGLSSNEMHQAVLKIRRGTSIASVYSELARAREKKLIVSKVDEGDGIRKQFLP